MTAKRAALDQQFSIVLRRAAQSMMELLMHRPKQVVIFAFAWLIAINLDSRATVAQLRFQMPSADQTLVLIGILENRPIDVSGVIRVRLAGAEKASGKVQGVPTALSLAPPTQIAPAITDDRISVEEKTATVGETVDIKVTVKGVDRPGVYKGSIKLLIAQQSGSDLTIPVDLKIGFKPIFEVTDKLVALSFSNCTGYCGFTEWINPGSTTSGRATFVEVLNKSVAPINLRAAASLKGTTTASGIFPPANSSQATILPSEIGRVPIALNSDLAADHYTGTVALTATVPDSAVGAVLKSDGTLTLENLAIATLPLTTDVRTAALWPFLILLSGVIVGRIGKLFADQSRLARVDLYGNYSRLNERLTKVHNAAAHMHCERLLGELWDRALHGDAADAKLKQEFANLEAKIELFIKLDALEQEIGRKPWSDDDKTAIRQHINQARQSLLKDDVAAARDSLELANQEIEARSNAHNARAAVAAAAAALRSIAAPEIAALTSAATKISSDAQTQANVERLQKSRPRKAFVNVLWFVSGIDTTESIAFYYNWGRPLAYLLLMIGLAFYGLWTLYIGPEHATFGAKGFTEYFALFLWGLGAQATAMTLRDIQFTKKT
jgi:hypothetical protein